MVAKAVVEFLGLLVCSLSDFQMEVFFLVVHLPGFVLR